jgi:glycerophosphoryl diester phosphodiesterase
MSTRPLLLGHRGARAVKSIPENTIASFDRALADGCDGFEFDVRLTGHSEGVVCHDPKAGTVEIARSSAQQLAGLPLFQDVLDRYFDTAFLDIELKVAGLEKVVIAGLVRKKPRRGFVISSFLPEVLRSMHAEDSSIPLGLIGETTAQIDLWKKLPIQYVIPHRRLVRQDLTAQIKSAGRRILVWTVNDPTEMKRLAEGGVDGIISDDPVLLVKVLGKKSSGG